MDEHTFCKHKQSISTCARFPFVCVLPLHSLPLCSTAFPRGIVLTSVLIKKSNQVRLVEVFLPLSTPDVIRIHRVQVCRTGHIFWMGCAIPPHLYCTSTDRSYKSIVSTFIIPSQFCSGRQPKLLFPQPYWLGKTWIFQF